MVTNRLWCTSVLLLALSSSITSRHLRMKREISPNPTNTSDSMANVTDSPDQKTTTVAPLSSSVTHTTEETGNISKISVDHPHTSELNDTQKHNTNKTSENGNHPTGNESATVYPPKGNTTMSTQPPIKNGSTGYVTQTGRTTPILSSTTTLKQTSTTKPTTSVKALPCPTASANRDGFVSRCLIVIAAMAALTSIFIISTICLATKLAGYRYRHKSHLLQETEMVCISALINDTDHPVPKPRHPKSNGALIPSAEDGDLDGDNLTLHSFLHDAEGPL